jgi:pyruvate carboxylase
VNFQKLKEELVKKHGDTISEKDVISAALYPKVFDDFHSFVDKYGPVDKLDTCTFLRGLDIGDEISVSDLDLVIFLTALC